MTILMGLLLLCAAWSVAASLLIVRELDKRGIQVRLIWMRLMLFNYLKQYIEMRGRNRGEFASSSTIISCDSCRAGLARLELSLFAT
jgi:hypothetical protein